MGYLTGFCGSRVIGCGAGAGAGAGGAGGCLTLSRFPASDVPAGFLPVSDGSLIDA